MKYLILFFSLIMVNSLNAHIDSLPSTNDLIQSLEAYYQKQISADLTEFQISEKGKWLKYIPSIGIGYTLGTGNEDELKNILRPSISFNTGIIYKVKQDKEVRRAKMAGIKKQLVLALEKEKLHLQTLLRKYRDRQEELAFLEKLQEIDSQLFEIASIQFTNAELAPSAYLPKKRAYLQKQYSLFKLQQELRDLEGDILNIAKVNRI